MSRLINHFIPLCGTLTVALLPRLAAAQECGADAPCPDGFECIAGMTDVACPAIACAEGSECEQPACGTPEPYSYCSPKQCDPEAANQCGSDMVCFSYESGMCSGSAGTAPACAPDDADCTDVKPVEPEQVECTTTVESYCTYKYQLPCEAAADCGAGFECVPYEITSCAGSEGTSMGGDTPSAGGASGGGSDPGAAAASSGGDGAGAEAPAEDRAVPIDPECTTELSEDKYCKVIDVTCETAAECEEGWTCEDMGVAVGGCTMTTPDDDTAPPPSTDPAEPAPAMDGGAAPAEGEALIAACDPAPMMEVEKKCAPPGYSYGYAYAADDGSVTTSAESGDLGMGTTGGEPPRDANGDPLPVAPGGTAGPGTNTGTNANGTSSNTDTAAGCSVGHSPTHSSTGFAGLLLGLAAFALRRKR